MVAAIKVSLIIKDVLVECKNEAREAKMSLA